MNLGNRADLRHVLSNWIGPKHFKKAGISLYNTVPLAIYCSVQVKFVHSVWGESNCVYAEIDVA